MSRPPTALSIAGSDPSGGAGVQADLKAFQDHGVYGMAVITALTAQNTTAVSAVHTPPPDFVAEQLAMVLADLPVDAVKIGMLADAGIVRAVARGLEQYTGPVVLDPVMVSTSGHRLLAPEAEAALQELLVPRATLVTPNLPEAAILLGEEPPQAWVARTGSALLGKDGHGSGVDVVDVLFTAGGARLPFHKPRLATRNTHGTGCTLSSAVAARLARGEGLEEAVGGALDWLHALIAASADHGLGAGHGPLLTGLTGPSSSSGS